MTVSFVTTCPRIHIGLIDLGFVTPRKYGGAGIMIDWPVIKVSARQSVGHAIVDNDLIDSAAQDDLLSLVNRLTDEFGVPSTQIEVHSCAPQHIGLGSKTALVMATIAAICDLYQMPLPNYQMQRLSGRGGVSGIGIHGFFTGGLIVDAGHPQDFSPHLPSRVIAPADIPLLLINRTTPVHAWRFFLLLPVGLRYHGPTEVDLFASKTPIDRSEVLESMQLMYHGILPSYLAGDLLGLRSALAAFHGVGFKRMEVDAQTPEVKTLLQQLAQTPFLAAGMSSVGPLIYAISNVIGPEVDDFIHNVCEETSTAVLAVCNVRTRGFEANRTAGKQ
jgi:beta-ribofuranosylaminobenzene 5'-phosphate synthase